MITKLTKKLKSRKAFTLIELIVVIAILGILAVIVVPKLGGYKASAWAAADKASAKIIENAINLAIADGSLEGAGTVTVTNGTIAASGFTTGNATTITNLLAGNVKFSDANSSLSFPVTADGTVTNPLANGGGGVVTPSLTGVTLNAVTNQADDHPTINNLPTATTGYSNFAWTGSTTNGASVTISGTTATFNRESWNGSTRIVTITLTATLTAGGTHTKTFSYSVPVEAFNGPNGNVVPN